MNIIHMYIRRTSVFMALVYCLAGKLSAGDFAASFLDIGVGARAMAMGGAFVSISNDGSGFYWNPAGLALLRKIQISGMYGPQFGSIQNPLGNFHYLGYVQPLPAKAVVALNWIRLSVDDIPIYSDLGNTSYWDRLHDISKRPDGTSEGTFKDTEDAFFFSFGLLNSWKIDLGWEYHAFRIDFPVGINIKYIHQSLGDCEASGIGLDIGGMLRFYLNDFLQVESLGILSFGINVQDVTDTRITWNTKHQDPVGTNFKWGFSYQHTLGDKGILNLAFDRDTRYGGKSHFGLEYCLFNLIGLRVGYDGAFTCGAGLHFWIFQVDYAFLTHELSPLHRINCAISF